MKKVLMLAVAAFTMITLSQSCKKKMKDGDLEKAAQEAITKAGMKTTVTVKDGVATLTGVCADEACKTTCEAAVKGIAGIKEVKNECTMAPASVAVSSLDAAVQKQITDGLKDIAGVTVSFDGKKAIFSGSTTTANKTKIAQMCNAAKVAADLSKVMAK